MSVEIAPFAFCDSSAPSHKLATLNHKPRHIVNDMMQRDFEAGTFRCQSCGVDHDLPSTGVDIYVCGPPFAGRGVQGANSFDLATLMATSAGRRASRSRT